MKWWIKLVPRRAFEACRIQYVAMLLWRLSTLRPLLWMLDGMAEHYRARTLLPCTSIQSSSIAKRHPGLVKVLCRVEYSEIGPTR